MWPSPGIAFAFKDEISEEIFENVFQKKLYFIKVCAFRIFFKPNANIYVHVGVSFKKRRKRITIAKLICSAIIQRMYAFPEH